MVLVPFLLKVKQLGMRMYYFLLRRFDLQHETHNGQLQYLNFYRSQKF